VGGAGVHPGVYLSTLNMSAIPVTDWCRGDGRDGFESTAALRAGTFTTVCDAGVCVKINYTERVTG
jgi:hypothetical protein